MFIVDKRERTSRVIGKSVETREMEVNWTWPGLSVREARRAKNSKNSSRGGGKSLPSYRELTGLWEEGSL